jgi:HK97 family phage major capsid protein
MTLTELIARKKGEINTRSTKYNSNVEELATLRGQEAPDEARIDVIRSDQAALTTELETLRADLATLERELAEDETVARLQSESHPTGARAEGYENQSRTGSEPRTYAREVDPKGVQFALDVARGFMSNDPEAQQRLQRHMAEERVERGDLISRAVVGTGAFTGLVVPQYLVEEFAPAAKAARPFADAARHHDLPEKGMTVNIGKLTTETSVDVQASQGDALSETDADDTLLTLAVQTAGGSQDLSRQAVERGEGVEDTIVDDLIRGYARNLDSKLLNQATNGLTNVASAITYTDASPTGEELYPKLLQAAAAAEAALLDADPGDVFCVMHSRRWYWLQSQLSSKWPFVGQPGIGGNGSGVNYAERYGNGFRGLLPNGTPVIVDNNISTILGAGTNEDEIYFASQTESHLWEDPNAPLLIRADQPKAKNLAVTLVVYGYFAYTFVRRAHAQKIGGTGLITPTWA